MKATLLLGLLFVVGLLAEGCGGSDAASSKMLDIANIGWTENSAISELTKVLLEEDLGYEQVSIHHTSLNSAFDDVAKGNLNAFQDVWLPNQRNLLGNVKDDVEQLGFWYQGQTKQGIAVPSYMSTKSLDELNDSDADLILGIEPSSVIMQKIPDEVIPAYGLQAKLVEASTDGMLAEVSNRYRNREEFAFVAWSPHWMNHRYDLRYLDDPQGVLAELNYAAQVTTIVNKNLRESDPVAYAFMKALRLNEKQLNDLEDTIEEVGDPREGSRQWAKQNQDVVQPWIEAAQNTQKA